MRYKITKNGYGNYYLYYKAGLFRWKFHDLFQTQQEAKDRAIELEKEKKERKDRNRETFIETFIISTN